MTDKITSHQDYLALLELMDTLFEDYAANKPQIDLLAPLLDEYEMNSAYFAEFNQSAAMCSPSQALLQVLMDQNGLTADDLKDVLGEPEQVAALLAGQKSFTTEQLSVLSKRFGFEPDVVNCS
jgi:antitoxin component HigA of HigAB toxin-antitoxin module